MKRLLAAMTAALMVLALAGTAVAAKPGYVTFGTVVESSPGTFTITVVGEAGGIYLKAKSNSGKDGSGFSFVSSGDVAGGAPRLSIPIDTTGDSTKEGSAFLDAAGCGGIVGTIGTTTVSTSSSACAVNYLSVDYANWAAFLAANPTARVAPANTPFIIADVDGTYIVSNIVLR